MMKTKNNTHTKKRVQKALNVEKKKKSNIPRIAVPWGEVRKSGTETLFNKIIAEKFPNVMDNFNQQIQETKRLRTDK